MNYNDFCKALASVTIVQSFLLNFFWRKTRQTCGGHLVPAHVTDRNCRVQSRELEGRSCHVSLFAREPSSLQRSTTLFPCTLFSPYSGLIWSTLSSHLHLMTTTLMTTMMMIILFFPTSLISVPWTTKPSHHLTTLLSSPLPSPTLLNSWTVLSPALRIRTPTPGLLWHR